MIRPGRYLQLRRRAAGLSVLATASALVGLPSALRRASVREINRMADRLHAAEADIAPLTEPQIGLLANVIPLQPVVYFGLCTARAMGFGWPRRICTECGCTDTMACLDAHGPCAWSCNTADLCTACENKQLDALLASVATIARPGAQVAL
ncbi:hypothetical protein [Novosphingobium sp. FSW06-99]|uniref:hypothetical protein n=1 Tax=Novosphingobium sp. FSW06-99 TaxID=1739113 RepID=UPI00076BE76E|nr:hypothetical protein [Novosphingobium sp. FSW06-99]KUR80781.1 hypothetical protein AQZ49_01770 [Novosphingobium sp. FSW06-99]